LVKLKRVRNQLETLGLLNSKYLYKRNDIYYFCVKIDNQVVKKSLFNNDFIYSNLLKYKIINNIREKFMEDKELNFYNNPFRKDFTIQRSGNTISVAPENQEEEQLLTEITSTIINKIKRLKNAGYNVSFEEESKNKRTLKESFEKFYSIMEKKHNEKYLTKFRQIRDLLYLYFGETKDITKITPINVIDFLDFLLSIPLDYKNIDKLKGKNIKVLIEKKSSLLDKYPKVKPSTVDEHIKKCKTIFNFLLDIHYINTNPFLIIKKQSTPQTKAETDWLPFKEEDLKEILKKTKKDTKVPEDHNLIKFCLYTGFRREELSILKVSDIQLEKGYVDFNYELNKVKTENSKRIVPIHKDIEELIKFQIKDKDPNDFFFYKDRKWKEENRGERIGGRINQIILEYFEHDKEIKKHYNLHSIRKNFIRTIFVSDKFSELDYKTIIGHSTNKDMTDKHYLMGLRDYDSYKSKMDKVSFEKFFEQPILNRFNNEIELNQ
jgi:integrase